ncbi:MAG: hypothetical protein WAM23_12125 [Candidatus Acidiferrales bacterium]
MDIEQMHLYDKRAWLHLRNSGLDGSAVNSFFFKGGGRTGLFMWVDGTTYRWTDAQPIAV